MTKHASSAWCGLLCMILLACSATLETVAVTNPAEFRGIRVHALESYVVEKRVVTEKCKPRTIESIEHLPLGRAYDVNFRGGWLAKNEFSVSFGDHGVLKQVTLNSDPQVDEVLTGAARLTEKTAATVGVAVAKCGATLSESILEVRPLGVKQ